MIFVDLHQRPRLECRFESFLRNRLIVVLNSQSQSTIIFQVGSQSEDGPYQNFTCSPSVVCRSVVVVGPHSLARGVEGRSSKFEIFDSISS